MNPLGIAAVAVIMVAFVILRWRALSRTGQYDPRTEWPYWLFGLTAIAVSVAVTFAGRLVMLVLTPIILIPAGIYLINRSSSLPRVGGLDLRNAGWLAIATGLLGGIPAVTAFVLGP